MKLRVILGWMAAVAAPLAWAQTTTNPDAAPLPSKSGLVLVQAQAPTTTIPPAADPAKSTTDPKAAADAKAKADAKKKAEAKKKEKEEPPIEGIVLARGTSGNQIGFQIKGNTFVLTFFDAKRKKIPVDVARGNIRWKNKFDPGSDHAVLTPSGTALTSDKVVPPPHNLKFFVSFYVEGKDTPVESYTVDYHD